MLSHHAHVKDGGASVDGVTRCAVNKMVGLYFNEGMREPARNGNPGELNPEQCRLSRHFLRARWRDPDDPGDCMVLHQMIAVMAPEEAERCLAVLREFTTWRPGPAGRGGDRTMRERLEAHARGQISRNVRQCIEPSLSAQDEDDEDDDTMSMLSTIVAGQQKVSSRQQVQQSILTTPADRVSQLLMLMDHIRRKNAATAEPMQPTTAGMVLTPPVGIEPSVTTSASASNVSTAESLSSAELLDILYRRIAAQLAAPHAAQKCALSPSLTTASSMPCVSVAATALADSTPSPIVPCTSTSIRDGLMSPPALPASLLGHAGNARQTNGPSSLIVDLVNSIMRQATIGRHAGLMAGAGHLPAAGNYGLILPPVQDVLCGRAVSR